MEFTKAIWVFVMSIWAKQGNLRQTLGGQQSPEGERSQTSPIAPFLPKTPARGLCPFWEGYKQASEKVTKMVESGQAVLG